MAIAGAAIVQYHKVAQGPAPTSNVCTFNGEPRTLTTKSETYD